MPGAECRVLSAVLGAGCWVCWVRAARVNCRRGDGADSDRSAAVALGHLAGGFHAPRDKFDQPRVGRGGVLAGDDVDAVGGQYAQGGAAPGAAERAVDVGVAGVVGRLLVAADIDDLAGNGARLGRNPESPASRRRLLWPALDDYTFPSMRNLRFALLLAAGMVTIATTARCAARWRRSRARPRSWPSPTRRC